MRASPAFRLGWPLVAVAGGTGTPVGGDGQVIVDGEDVSAAWLP